MHVSPEDSSVPGERVFDAVLSVYGLTTWTGQGLYADPRNYSLGRRIGEEPSNEETQF